MAVNESETTWSRATDHGKWSGVELMQRMRAQMSEYYEVTPADFVYVLSPVDAERLGLGDTFEGYEVRRRASMPIGRVYLMLRHDAEAIA